MNEPVFVYFMLIGLSILGILKNSVSFNPLRFHCDNYIFSTYLYFILSWGIALATVTSLSKYKYNVNELFTGPFLVVIFLLSILLLVGLSMIPPEMFFTKHILFVLEIIILGITLYPLYSFNKDRFNHVGLTTLLILTVLSILVYVNPTLISDNIVTYLFIGLLGVIIARLVEMFLLYRNKEVNTKFSKTINYIVIILFSFYIMYDTKNIIRNAEQCRVSPIGPDYIRESINLFLDSMNMFSGVYHARND